MKKQKFKRGDVVHIAKDLGPSMAHFENDLEAVVMGSYRDQYGGDNAKDYTLMFCRDGNEVSWYGETQLTFLRHGGEAEIERIKFEREKRKSTERDINWIMANWLGIRENPSGATLAALMRLIGIENPWPSGEGWELAENQMRTFALFDPILSTGDIKVLNAFLAKHGFETVQP